MANDITTKVWDLDSAGVVSVTPVIIDGISVTWKVASAGTVVMDVISEGSAGLVAGGEVFYAASTGASSAATNELTQWFDVKTTVTGLRLTTIADVAKLLVYTK